MMPTRRVIARDQADWSSLIGISYALSGQDRAVGLNCYGLVREVYRGLAIELPQRGEPYLSPELIAEEGPNWVRIPAPEPYAVALMQTRQGLHLGVVTPTMELLRCDTSKGVVLSNLRKYDRVILAYYRYKENGGEILPDGAGGDIGRTIGQVLVAVATIAVTVMTAGALTPLVGPVWGMVLGGLAGMATSMIGNMVINALCPLSDQGQDVPSLSGWDNSLKDSRTYTWDGIVNDHRQGLAKPFLFGTMKLGGQIISEKTRYDANSNEFFDMLISPCRGRITRFDDIRINDTEYYYYDQTQIAMRPGDDEQTCIDMFKMIYTQYKSGALVRYDASTSAPTTYLGFSSKGKITGARFVITAPRGIYEMVSNVPNARGVVYRIQYKKASASTWDYVLGDFSWQSASIVPTATGFSGRIVNGFDIATDCNAFRFTLTSYPTIDGSTTFTFSRYKVYYRKVGATSWIHRGTYEVGACYYGYYASGSWAIEVSGLELGQYQVRVDWASDCCTNLSGTHNTNAFAMTDLLISSQSEEHTITGNSANPLEAVSVTKELLNLEEDTYNFRMWRTTTDQTSVYWSDDIFLNNYSEIIDDELAYPNHALLGVSAMATDRLSGSRPTLTAIATGAPLSVPAVADRYDTTVYQDEGLVTGTGNIVNAVNIDGMRKVLVNATLPAPSDPSVVYYWLVMMASPGFAQPDRQLTKHYKRVHTWEIVGSRTRLYLQSSETIPAGSEVMVFYENYAPTDSVAWGLTKMLIDGSHGRITANHIIWDSFADLDAYCNDMPGGQVRHKLDAIIDFQEDLWGLATRIAGQADAILVPCGNKYKVVIDRAVTAPRQVFGTGNTKNVRILPIPKRDRANMLVASFKDENLNYEERAISEQDVQASELPIVKNLGMIVGITREWELRRYLARLLRYNRYVDHSIEFDASPESIETEAGDVFGFQSRANDFSASGRILGTNTAGDAVVLDRSCTVIAGETYRLMCWGSDGTVRTWEGTFSTDTVTEVPRPSGLAIDNEKPYECNYILARVQEKRSLYRATSIKRSPSTMAARITGVVYVPELYID